MKSGLFTLAAVSLVGVTFAQAQHQGGHAAVHNKRDDVYTETVYQTATAADVVVFVDDQGNPVSTSTMGAQNPVQPVQQTATPTTLVTAQAAQSQPSSGNVFSTRGLDQGNPNAWTSTYVWTPPATWAPGPSDPAPSNPAPSSTTTANNDNNNNNNNNNNNGKVSGGHEVALGVTYSPYNDDGSCREAGDIKSDLAALSAYKAIRIHSAASCKDKNMIQNVLSSKASDVKLMLGVDNIYDVAGQLGTITAAVNNNWNDIHTISVGNEVLQGAMNNGTDSHDLESTVVNAIGAARGALQNTGFKGQVVTVDTVGAVQKYSKLCQNSDYSAVNSHAFFDPNTDANGAGPFVLSQASLVKTACGSDKPVVITESGWPSQCGAPPANTHWGAGQTSTAMKSLKGSFQSGMYLFSAYNEKWKGGNCEQFFGISD